ncbi:MAG: RsmE family RNA methyltransferase [Candidatus Cloacimonetes bacterium]|jgi:16S rRNA (uracil1498-N3)-methyltransferase|nr:16S rRNA (uracil(1498)-N(3))-methyltransferase [Candidatus Cloacimonadota bacterium]MDD2211063.1 RsmE family RNA methyltransferase [Candidatus Cloacimonadota bacterium]MDY0299617.1 RsmE family RNA methyltransferase [Candidatus Cloacimonadaceae bacterium]
MPSYYCPDLNANSKQIVLDKDEHHHLCRVKRIGVNDVITLNNGRGILADCKILKIDKSMAVLEPINIEYHNKSKITYAIAFALLKNRNDELVVEKCTELGASDFFPFISENTVKEEGKNTIERFKKIVLSAMKQCNNPWMPQVHNLARVQDLVNLIVEHGYEPVVCSEHEQENWLNMVDCTQNICFIIGPEGGFSNLELGLMKGIDNITIGSLVTRAETAAIAIASQYLLYKELSTK